MQHDLVGNAQFCRVDAAWKELEDGFGRDAADHSGKVFCAYSEAAHCLSQGRTQPLYDGDRAEVSNKMAAYQRKTDRLPF